MLSFRYLHLCLGGCEYKPERYRSYRTAALRVVQRSHRILRSVFHKKETHIRRTLWHIVFFSRQTNQEKITFCVRPASVSVTLSWEIRGFRARILKSQINCWKIQRAYCSTFLTVFLVILTDADTQWPTGVHWKCQVNNVLRELRGGAFYLNFFFRGFFFAV